MALKDILSVILGCFGGLSAFESIGVITFLYVFKTEVNEQDTLSDPLNPLKS